jgi:hypothetical protein
LLVQKEKAEGGCAVAGASSEFEPELGRLTITRQVEQRGKDEGTFRFDGVGTEQAGEAGMGLRRVHDEADGQVY